MFTQQLKYLKIKLSDFPTVLDQTRVSEYAFIVHDKDTTADGKLKENHVHVVMKFENARTVTAVAKIFSDEP